MVRVVREWLAAAVLMAAALSLVVAGPAPAAVASPLGPAPGRAAHAINVAHLEDFEFWNLIQVVDAGNRVIRTIKIAGNPNIIKPAECFTDGRIRTDWDLTHTWLLNWFVRMCAGRGVGTHDIPINAFDGRRSMNVADLGKRPGLGSPLSHGCLRMAAADAQFIYDHYSLGTPVFFIRTPWRAATPLPPGPPTLTGGVAGNSSVAVSWNAPAAVAGSSPVTGYAVLPYPAGHAVVVSATSRTATVTGLLNGARYQFRVVALTAAGSTLPSAYSALIMPNGPPGPPISLRAGLDRTGTSVTWTAPPTGTLTVTGYTVTVTPGPGAAVSLVVPVAPGSGLPAGLLLSWLVPGVSYGVSVTATDALGTSVPGVLAGVRAAPPRP